MNKYLHLKPFDFTGWGWKRVYRYLKGCGYDYIDWNDDGTVLTAIRCEYDEPVIVHFTEKGRAKKSAT